MQDELVHGLAGSGLREASSAIALLNAGGRADAHQHGASCSELLCTYELRLRHVRSMSSEHAHRLAEAVSELVSNLEACRLKTAQWITVGGAGGMKFSILRLEDGRLLGCLPVVNKLEVSDERWAELWGRNA